MTGTTNGNAVRSHLAHILASPGFIRSKRLGAFLSWVVNQSIAGNEALITERNIALLVYGRPNDFDPKLDGTVRAEAMRLRHKLREYYEDSIPGSPRIEIPKGSYAPLFSGFDRVSEITQRQIPAASVLLPSRQLPAGIAFALLGTAALVVATVGWLYIGRHTPPVKSSALVAEANRLRVIGDDFSASALLDKAIAADPNAADAHLARALVYRNLGHMSQARVEMARAQELGPDYGVLRQEIAAHTDSLDGDASSAIQRIRALLKQQPNSSDLLTELARLEIDPGNAIAAEAAIRAVRNSPEGMRDPEPDRLEALLLGFLGQNKAAIEIALRGERKAAALKATWSLGRLLVLEGGLRQIDAEPENVIAATLQRARDLCLSTGDQICVAQTYRVDGNRILLLDHKYQEALGVYRKGLTITRQWGNWHEAAMLQDGVAVAIHQLDPKFMATDFIQQPFERFSDSAP